MLEEIRIRREFGFPVDGPWLWEKTRLQSTLSFVKARMGAFGQLVQQATISGQTRSTIQAVIDADRIFRSLQFAKGSVSLLKSKSFEKLIGHFADGSPIRGYFEHYGAQVADVIERKLIGAVINSQGARETARQMSRAIGEEALKIANERGFNAIVTARTEPLRVYRQATIDNYAENPELVDGYIRLASLDQRTCPVCLALSGTWYRLSEPFESHAACRCTCVPSLRDSSVFYAPTGPEWFDEQPEAVQTEILGTGKYELYREGRIQLNDLVRRSTSPTFGPQVRVATLRELYQLAG